MGIRAERKRQRAALIRQMRDDGHTAAQIARAVGIRRSTLYQTYGFRSGRCGRPRDPALRAAVLDGVGKRLGLKEIAALAGKSRWRVWAVLRELEAEGLVERGWRVTPLWADRAGGHAG